MTDSESLMKLISWDVFEVQKRRDGVIDDGRHVPHLVGSGGDQRAQGAFTTLASCREEPKRRRVSTRA